MFTGLIEGLGRVVAVGRSGSGQSQKRVLTIENRQISPALALGDSVAISGVCLTVVKRSSSRFIVEALGDTIHKTTVSQFRTGTIVNLERALLSGDRLDGHIVQGHVNGVATVLGWDQGPGHRYLTVELPTALADQVVDEGSIAIDGISLTIAEISGRGGRSVRVSIIPHTFDHTSLASLKSGSVVNIETDVLLRRGSQSTTAPKSSLSLEKLAAWGYA